MPIRGVVLKEDDMYVVTGGTGFIGSNIIAQLETKGMGPIVVIDRLRETNKWRNISKRNIFDIVPPESTFEFLNSAQTEIKALIHMGAVSSTTETDADFLYKTNFQLSTSLWNWCTVSKKPFIYASSAATYGDGSLGFDDNNSFEFLRRLTPLNAYAWTKHQFDLRVAEIILDNGPRPPQWAGLKFFNVYGPNEYHKGKMASIASKAYSFAAEDKSFQLFKSHNPNYTDGGQLRDFVWVEDCVDIVLWILGNSRVNGIFNCGSGKARSFLSFVDAVYKTLGKKTLVDFVDTPFEIRENYQYFTEAKMVKLRNAGYSKPMTELEVGVERYIINYLNTNDPFC